MAEEAEWDDTRTYRQSTARPLPGPSGPPPSVALPDLPRDMTHANADVANTRPTSHRSNASTSNASFASPDPPTSRSPSTTTSSPRGTSSRSVLTVALQRAQSAVLLDSANNVPAAVAAYTQSVRLLEEVMARVEDSAASWRAKESMRALYGEPRGETERQRQERLRREEKAAKREKARLEESDRLRNIHDTYLERIRMLTRIQSTKSEHDPDEEPGDGGSLPTSAYQADVDIAPRPHASSRASMSTITPNNASQRSSYGFRRASPLDHPELDDDSDPETDAVQGIGTALLNGTASQTNDPSPARDSGFRPSSRSFPALRVNAEAKESPNLEYSTPTLVQDEAEGNSTSDLESNHPFAHPYSYSLSESNRSSAEILPVSSRADTSWLSAHDANALHLPQYLDEKPLPSPTPTSSSPKLPVPTETPKRDSGQSTQSTSSSLSSGMLAVPPPGSPAAASSAASSTGSFESLYSTDPVRSPDPPPPPVTPRSAGAKRRPSLADLVMPYKGVKKSSTVKSATGRLINATTDRGTISQRRRSPNPDTFGASRFDDLPTNPKGSFSLSRRSSKSPMEADEFGVVPPSPSTTDSATSTLPMRLRSASQPGRRPSLASIKHPPLPMSARPTQSLLNGIRKVSAPPLAALPSSPSTPELVAHNSYFDDPSSNRSELTYTPTPTGGTSYPNSLSSSTTFVPTQLSAPLPPFPRALFAPVSPLRRPFQLMQRIKLSIQQGGYITPRLYAPKALWQATSSKLTGLDTKTKCIDLLLGGLEGIEKSGEGLLVARAVDQPSASRTASTKLFKELESFDALLFDIQGTLNKKLGFIEPAHGKKSSNALGAFLPKLSRQMDRMNKSRSVDTQLIYCEALARLFAESDLFDRHLALCSGETSPTPYPDLAAETRIGIEGHLKRISDFYAKVVLRFVLRDLGILLDKHGAHRLYRLLWNTLMLYAAKLGLGWAGD